MTTAIHIDRGACHALFAYDVGFSIDLVGLEKRLAESAHRETVPHKPRAPRVLEFNPPPVRTTRSATPICIGTLRTGETVDALLYDFGAVSVAYTLPLAGPLDGLLAVSESLYENAALLADSRQRVESLVAAAGDAVKRPHVPTLVEDYAIYQIEAWSARTEDAGESSASGGPGIETTGADARSSAVSPSPQPFGLPTRAPSAWKGEGAGVAPSIGRSPIDDTHGRSPLDNMLNSHAATLARILRGETAPLSQQEIADALACRISYGPDDATIIDWNAALVFDRQAEDVRTVLEFANVELLEMRVLDAHLDKGLESSYDVVSRRRLGVLRAIGSSAAELRRIAQLQADSAMLFEGVNNNFKLIGDQYLARVYRLASQRFHLADWDAGILRKLATLESIYQKLADQQSHRRSEVLEWIIIALIAFEIAMSLFPGWFRH